MCTLRAGFNTELAPCVRVSALSPPPVAGGRDPPLTHISFPEKWEMMTDGHEIHQPPGDAREKRKPTSSRRLSVRYLPGGVLLLFKHWKENSGYFNLLQLSLVVLETFSVQQKFNWQQDKGAIFFTRKRPSSVYLESSIHAS